MQPLASRVQICVVSAEAQRRSSGAHWFTQPAAQVPSRQL